MSVPFKYKPPFREIFETLTSKSGGKLNDIKDFHGYMKAPFSAEILDKFSEKKPFVIDDFFAFLGEAKNDSGLSFDDIMWNFVDKFIRHQVFNGENTIEMKALRSYYDPFFKSIQQSPEALWSKHCGAAATTATVSGLVGIIKELQPKGTPLSELLKPALPKNKPLKPAPALRAASPRKTGTPGSPIKSTPPPSSPAEAKRKADEEAAKKKAEEEEAAAAKKKKEEEDAAAAAKKTSTPSATTPEPSEAAVSSSAGADTATPAVASPTTADKKPETAPPQQQQPAMTSQPPPPPPPQQQQQQQVPAVLANASAVPSLQPTALGASIQTASQQQQNQIQTPRERSNTVQLGGSGGLPNRGIGQQQSGGAAAGQQQQQQLQQGGIINNNTGTAGLPLGLSHAAPLGPGETAAPVTIPANVASALAEIDQRHEQLRAEVEAQIAAVVSTDGILATVTQRMKQLQNAALPAPESKHRHQLDAIRQQMGMLCKSINVDLDSYRRNVPQYVADIGKAVAAGKALDHAPNEEFGELRLHDLLQTVRKEQEDLREKEKTANRLARLQEQEEALKKEIAAMERGGGNTIGGLTPQQQKSAKSPSGKMTAAAAAAAAAAGSNNNSSASSAVSARISNRVIMGGSASSPVPAAAGGGGTAASSSSSAGSLSIAQRIAARVNAAEQRGPGTANYAMPATGQRF